MVATSCDKETPFLFIFSLSCFTGSQEAPCTALPLTGRAAPPSSSPPNLMMNIMAITILRQ